MKSSTTPEFWRAYAALPPEVKKAARKNFRLWLRNPRHGPLQFQRKGRYWCARVTPGYRALAVSVADGYLWFGSVRMMNMSGCWATNRHCTARKRRRAGARPEFLVSGGNRTMRLNFSKTPATLHAASGG